MKITMLQTALSEQWLRFSKREQRLLVAGVLLLGLVSYWLVLYRPLSQAVHMQEEKNQTLIRDWHWMRQQLPLIQTRVSGSARLSRITDGPLLSWLDAQLAQAGVQDYVKRLEPVDESRVTLWFEAVPFDLLMRWLTQLQRQRGVLVSEFDAAPLAAQPGLASVRLTLYQP